MYNWNVDIKTPITVIATGNDVLLLLWIPALTLLLILHEMYDRCPLVRTTKQHATSFRIVGNAFNIDKSDAPEYYQLETIALKANSILHNLYAEEF